MALEGLMPENENEFNNFKDTVFDKFNRPGYLIQRDGYYIFQPFDIKEKATMFDRNTMNIDLDNPASLENYLINNYSDKLNEKKDETKQGKKKLRNYNVTKWVNANAENIPLKDNSFDFYTISFGLRNTKNIKIKTDI